MEKYIEFPPIIHEKWIKYLNYNYMNRLLQGFSSPLNIMNLDILEENIETRPLWKPMHLQPVFATAPYYGENSCEHLFDKGLCLPSGSNLTDEDRERITAILNKM